MPCAKGPKGKGTRLGRVGGGTKKRDFKKKLK